METEEIMKIEKVKRQIHNAVCFMEPRIKDQISVPNPEVLQQNIQNIFNRIEDCFFLKDENEYYGISFSNSFPKSIDGDIVKELRKKEGKEIILYLFEYVHEFVVINDDLLRYILYFKSIKDENETESI